MDNILEKTDENDYRYLFKKFGKEKIASRFAYVNNVLDIFIKQRKYEGRVVVSQNLVEHIVIDYFVDIDRLKEFQGIELVSEVKIYAYLSYWIIRHKPLQIVASDGQDDLVFINEELASDFLTSFLLDKPACIPILEESQQDIDEFKKTLEYHLAYRNYTAQNIELMLLAFQAGRQYQYSVDYQR